ncbi:MAG: hypothetical protein MZV63_45935 [Marinilabiliales bacterium]|nr:hypothetical protein [Marinilabiliales bacterium]
MHSDDIKISLAKPATPNENCFKGVVNDILPSEYGMELTVDAGEVFYVDVSVR